MSRFIAVTVLDPFRTPLDDLKRYAPLFDQVAALDFAGFKHASGEASLDRMPADLRWLHEHDILFEPSIDYTTTFWQNMVIVPLQRSFGAVRRFHQKNNSFPLKTP